MENQTGKSKTDIYIRVAWFNRENQKYNFGAWHNMNDKTPKDYQSLQKWIDQQNKKFPRTRHWVEMKDTDDEHPKNKEVYEMIAVTNEKQQNTDWLAI